MNIIDIVAAGMREDNNRLSIVSSNLANVLTPGYKRQIAAERFDATLAALGAPSSSHSIQIDSSAGALRATGNAADIAIEGDAWFEFDTAAGPRYSRGGMLHVDTAGRLVNAQGAPIVTSGGAVLTSAAFRIDPNGDIVQGGRVTGRVKLVSFDHPERLQPAGAGLYDATGLQASTQTLDSRVRSGFMEASNVNSPQEMVRLSETVRHFESLQRAVQGYDEALGSAIRKLGEF
ncbi:flagellar hook-basal body protein [Massilia forsythiae]|uniref:Flagellar hook-basal body protein n=1 Tax=Massilia forsythiae TaxID=2728020 RepID=A0A7Z2VUJ9_9BURK|nr:flagellar hook-basal body protein [Massilia forsythiae]QJD99495.1 flagellar hook-basal body protein [Massilia forsythiae]